MDHTHRLLFEARIYHHLGKEALYRVFQQERTLFFVRIGNARKYRPGGAIDLFLSLAVVLTKHISPQLRQELEKKIILWSTGLDEALLDRLAATTPAHMVSLSPHSFILDFKQIIQPSLRKKRNEFLYGFHLANWYFTDPNGVHYRFMLETEENFCCAYQQLTTLFGTLLQRDKAMTRKGGDPFFQLTMGYYFHTSHQDYGVASHWYALAANQNVMPAQYQLGRFYQEGLGVPQDYALAVKWYTIAANFGEMESQLALGRCHEQGLGVPQDLFQAVQWYRRSAEQSLPEAMYHLARCYENGLGGVAKDLAEAAQWYQKSARLGYSPARESLDQLKGGQT